MPLLWEQGAAGSNPATSTINLKASFVEAFLFVNLFKFVQVCSSLFKFVQ